jgi:hypothetical protein
MNDGLSIATNWQMIYNNTIFAGLNPENEKIIPIDTIYVEHVFTNKFSRFYLKSQSAKPHWWLGGYLTQTIESNTPLDFHVAPSQRMPLNVLTLIQSELLISQYFFKLKPAEWLKEISIVIEEYIGD